MATCLSPVNLAAPMSAFFLKPVSPHTAYAPFPRDIFAAASTVTRQPRGPPQTNATSKITSSRKAAPAPVNVPAPSAPTTSWRDRVSAGPAEMPKTPKTPRTPSTPKSAKRKGRRNGSQSPASAHSRVASAAASPAPAPVSLEPEVEVKLETVSASAEDKSPASRVYSVDLLLNLWASPLNGVTEEERTHMENLVYNYTWRRGPHQTVSRSSSRASSRSSSPSPSLSSSSRPNSPAPIERVSRLRRDGQPRRASSKLRNTTSDGDRSD